MNGLTNRLENWYDAMHHVTEHTPRVSTRWVNPYACESLQEKRQKDRQTDRQTTDRRTDRRLTDGQTHWRIAQNHFSRRFEGCSSQIRSSWSRFLARCQYFYWHGSKIWKSLIFKISVYLFTQTRYYLINLLNLTGLSILVSIYGINVLNIVDT